MLCPGISQNTKHHHLTLYKGRVWGEKSYHELCDNNILSIKYAEENQYTQGKSSPEEYIMPYLEEFIVPSVPGVGFILDQTQITYTSEILQSFTKMNQITSIAYFSG